MNAAEYNKWLKDRLWDRRDAVCKRLETILPQAWSDYVTECKVEGKVVTEYFWIYQGKYGLSSEDIEDLFDHSRTVGEYHVSGDFSQYTGKWYLKVVAPEFMEQKGE
jgi:hypothetical protein